MSHLLRLRNARAFDEQIIVLVLIHEVFDRHEQIAAQRAANAAVLHLD